MNHGSLFSGIGGFDLASEWMGWNNVFHCEWNEFGQKVLKYYWPKSISYGDITQTDFTIHRGRIDIITGGFPCQPYSTAGKRLGKEDDRHLWPEMLRAIREIQPTWIVGENVRGLTNWNGGLVFDEVQTDLEAEGYEVTSFLLPACAVNAPHRRDRIWFIAYRSNERFESLQSGRENGIHGFENAPNAHSFGLQETGTQQQTAGTTGIGAQRIVADPYNKGLERKEWTQKSIRPKSGDRKINWKDFPTQSPVCSRNDGLSSQLDGITFPKWRNESIKGAGNAIVPQVSFEIFKAIDEWTRNF